MRKSIGHGSIWTRTGHFIDFDMALKITRAHTKTLLRASKLVSMRVGNKQLTDSNPSILSLQGSFWYLQAERNLEGCFQFFNIERSVILHTWHQDTQLLKLRRTLL